MSTHDPVFLERRINKLEQHLGKVDAEIANLRFELAQLTDRYGARLTSLEMSRSASGELRQHVREIEARLDRLGQSDSDVAEQAEALRAGMRVLGQRADRLAAALREVHRLAIDSDASMAARLSEIAAVARALVAETP